MGDDKYKEEEMSHLGMGVMIWALGGGSPKSADDYYGRTVTSADINDERLLMTFDDGVTIKIWDNGQSCCESRYITCDDDPKNLIGGKLIKIEVKNGGENEGDEWGNVHETAFVEVTTDAGHIVMTTHNEHNGYYGGFGLSINEV